MLKHGFNKLEAHATACQAPRGDIQPEEYYDDVSDDETILDLIEEMDKEQYEQQYMDSISNYKIPDFNNNDDGTCSVNIRNEEMASDMANSCFQVINCDQYSDISSCGNPDQELDNDKMSSELDYFDEDVYDSDNGPVVAHNDFEDDAVTRGDVSDEDVIGDGDDADEIDNVNEADDISDTDAIDTDDKTDEFGNGDEADEFGNVEEADDFGYGDEADEFGNGDEAGEFGDGDEADEFSDGDEAMANGDGNNVKTKQ